MNRLKRPSPALSHPTSGLPQFQVSSSKVFARNIVAHPFGALASCAKRSAERRKKNIPPIRPCASRASQNPFLLRPIKNSGITRLRTLASGRFGRIIGPRGVAAKCVGGRCITMQSPVRSGGHYDRGIGAAKHAHVSSQKPPAALDVAPRPSHCIDGHCTLGSVSDARVERSRQSLPKARLGRALERTRPFIGSENAHARLPRFVAPLPNLLPSAYKIEMKPSRAS